MARLVEPVEVGRHLICVLGEHVRGSDIDGATDHLGEAQEAQDESPFLVDGRGHDRAGFDAGFARTAQDRLDPHRPVLQVRAGLAFERREPVEVEDVVRRPVVGQVAELQRAETDLSGDPLALLGWIVLSDLGFVEPGSRGIGNDLHQVGEAQHSALAGLERCSVRSVHRPERDVLQADGVGGDPGDAGGPEDLFEVQRLACVDDIEDEVVPLLDPLLERRQVGRRVEVRAVGPGEQQRRHLLLVVGPFDVDDDGAVRLAGEAVVVQEPIDERCESLVNGALPAPQVELDAEPLEVLLLLGDGHVAIVAPERQVSGSPVLEIERGSTGPLRFVRIVLASLDDDRVHLGEVVERHRRLLRVRAGEVGVEVREVGPSPFEFDDELPDRHAPVAHVDVACDVMSGEAEEPFEALADDRRPEMADVHRLGHVRAAVVDDHLVPGVRFGEPEAVVAFHVLGV